MKKILFGYQSIGLLLFLIAFGATFFITDIIRAKASVAVNKKLVKSVDKLIQSNEEKLASPKVTQLLSEQQLFLVKEEIARYKANPEQYVAKLTSEKSSIKKPTSLSELKDYAKNTLTDKVFTWKDGIKKKFDQAIGSVVSDVRVFMLSNLVVFALALFFNMKSAVGDKLNYLASSVSAIPVVVSVVGVFNSSFLISFLQNPATGWTYTLGLAGAYGWMLFEHFKRKVAVTA